MQNNKKILEHCPNFYKIIDFEFYEDDKISEKLISLYKDYIFMINPIDDKNLKKIEKIDYILNKYIDDYFFRKEIQRSVLNIRVKAAGNFVEDLIEGIFNIYESFENGYTRNIYFARWI